MKTIGLLGGMSWVATVPYYKRLNELVAEEAGATHSARILLYSVDFAEVEALHRQRGIASRRHVGRLVVPPDVAHGATLIFEAA